MCNPLEKLKNIGTSSANALNRINVYTLDDLERRGAISCFEALCKLDDFKPSLNFLYAMLGAIENKHWTEYKNKKGELLLQLENNRDVRINFIHQLNE